MPDQPPVAWGIAGFGWVARDYMLPAILAAGHRLVAICDSDPLARFRARELGVRAYESFEAMAADPKVEAVYVATPNHLHRLATETFVRAGKAVLCEKPMAATLADAKAMAEAARRAGVLYGTAFDQRHHPAHRALRDAIRSGLVGTVTALRMVYTHWLDAASAPGGSRDNWRIDQHKAGGGAMMELAPHGLDLLDFLVDEPVSTLAALTQARVQDYAVDDGALLIGATRSGILVSLHVAYNSPEKLPRRRLEILGTQGQLTAENTMGQDPGGDVVFTASETGRPESLPVPDGETSPFLNQVRAFARALRIGNRDTFSADRDLRTMRLIEKAYRSAQSGGAVR